MEALESLTAHPIAVLVGLGLNPTLPSPSSTESLQTSVCSCTEGIFARWEILMDDLAKHITGVNKCPFPLQLQRLTYDVLGKAMLSFCMKREKKTQAIAMCPENLVRVGCDRTMFVCSKRG